MKGFKSAVITLGAVALVSCSSVSELPTSWGLNTTPHSQNYVYCESCPAPTKLVHQDYKPLEPDEPIVSAKPVIEPVAIPIQIRNYKKKRKPQAKHYKKRSKKVQTKPKQCIKWS